MAKFIAKIQFIRACLYGVDLVFDAAYAEELSSNNIDDARIELKEIIENKKTELGDPVFVQRGFILQATIHEICNSHAVDEVDKWRAKAVEDWQIEIENRRRAERYHQYLELKAEFDSDDKE